MSRSVAVTEDLYNKAAELTAREHLPVEEFITAILTNRVADREFIDARAKLFNRKDFERALSEIPDVEPEDHDRLSSAGWRHRRWPELSGTSRRC